VVAVAPRLVHGLLDHTGLRFAPGVWDSTRLVLPPEIASHTWTDALSGAPTMIGREPEVGTLVERFPVSALVGAAAP
jgi:maltooligosyltrehalose synthase